MSNINYAKKVFSHWDNFIKERLAQREEISLEIATGSMRPLIQPQNKVIVKGCKIENLEAGDIVLFKRDSQLYVHRLLNKKIQNGEVILIPKADRAHTADEPFPEEQFLGRVVGLKKNSTTLNLERQPWRVINKFLYLLSKMEIQVFRIAYPVKNFLYKKLLI